MSYNEFLFNTDILVTLHSELSISIPEHHMSLQYKKKSSFLFHFRSLFENFIKGNSYSHYKIMCGMLILLLKRNRFSLLLILSILSLCTILHIVQGGFYISFISYHKFSAGRMILQGFCLKICKNYSEFQWVQPLSLQVHCVK